MNRKKAGILMGLLVAVGLIAAVSAPFATVTLTRLGTYWMSSLQWDSATAKQAGGVVNIYNAGDSERVGNIVYLSANNTVSSSATLGNYGATNAGVVVGGTRSSPAYAGAADTTEVGTLAATSGQQVVVLCAGRAFVKTADSVYFGNEVIPGAVAGTVKRRTTAIDSTYRIFGRAVITRDSGKVIPLQVNVC